MEATIFGLSAYLGLLILAGSLTLGAMTASFLEEASFGLGRGKFRDKLGGQFAAMGVKGLLCLVLLLVPAAVWLASLVPDPLAWCESLSDSAAGEGLLPLLAGWLGMTIYSGSWAGLGRKKWLHRILGGLSLLALLAGTYGGMNVLWDWTPGGGLPEASSWKAMWYPAAWSIWPAWIALVSNGIGAAGILGTGYLLLRRNRDDFGRDYYRFALARSARWGLVLILPVLITAGWLALRGLTGLALLPCAAAGLAALASVWLALRLIRSRHPLRLKGSVLLACLLAWLLDAALVLSLLWAVWSV